MGAAHRWDFFISHAGADIAAARELYDVLNPRARTFLDEKCLLLGDDWDTRLAAEQRRSAVTLVLTSSRSEAAYYQRDEVAAAISLSRENPERHRVVPVYLDSEAENAAPFGLRIKHGISLSKARNWKGVVDRLIPLLEAIQKQDEHPRATTEPADLPREPVSGVGGPQSEPSIFAEPRPRSPAALLKFEMIRLFSGNQPQESKAWTEIRNDEFRRNYELGADPVFEITVANQGSKTILVYRVGIRVLQRIAGTGGCMGYPQPVPVQAEFRVRCPQEWKQTWGIIDKTEWTDFVAPIEMKKGDSAYNFTLVLENFCDPDSSSSCEVRFYLVTGNGTAESRSIWLSQ